MPQGPFFACRVLLTKTKKFEFVVFQESEIARRNDVEVSSRGYRTKAAARAEIERLGGVIPDGIWYLDFWEEDSETVWNWKDDRTGGSSQVFKSREEAVDAMKKESLVFDVLLD